ncbi:CBS domain-containing protein [Aestuariivirga sp.]|uniref:CBS domain-containing protein n=1 Tax=Aestuariivirga sp. TaxID=2650926 RepID=UPI00301B2761
MTATRILDKKGYQIFTISEAASIKDVIHELAKRKIGALIVTDVAGEGVGIISERDVIHQLSKNFDTARTAGDAMTRTITKCSLDDTDNEIMERMDKAQVRHLPVQHAGKLVGIISARDVINLRIEKLNELMQDIRVQAARQKA